mmetsp:Transcript_47823/g.79588  ORF Transcript_47823/g.79588 Transcript_47823/m.79588 type:complete len:180 (-) Transcript_47823:531-1070(-)
MTKVEPVPFVLPEWAGLPRKNGVKLEIVKNSETVGEKKIDDKRAYLLGRSPDCDIVLEHPSVSRHHCALVHHKNGTIFVLDLGSVHGTQVAGERIDSQTPTLFEEGCTLRVAASSRVFILRGSTPPRDLSEYITESMESSEDAALVEFYTSMNRKIAHEASPSISPFSPQYVSQSHHKQ